jgi:hypothetical protein
VKVSQVAPTARWEFAANQPERPLEKVPKGDGLDGMSEATKERVVRRSGGDIDDDARFLANVAKECAFETNSAAVQRSLKGE